MHITDTHAHIYLPEFADDLDAVLKNAPFVSKIFMPNIDLSTLEPMHHVQAAYPDQCFACIGLHPCSVKEDYQSVLATLEKQLFNNKIKYYGIGETGLDYYWDLTFKKEQIEALEMQLEWAKTYQLPVIIHSREALDDCLTLVEKHQNGKLKGVFHCFSGTSDQLQRALD
ncbi:MAG: TatD family hydrolase, partial [Chitinophagales bacterium]